MIGWPRIPWPKAALRAGFLLAAACGSETGALPQEEPTELEARASAPVELRAIDPSRTGAIRGRVRFAGEPPEPLEIPLIRECQSHGEKAPDERLVVGPDGGLAGALIHVRRGLSGYVLPEALPAQVELDQVGCRYVPHVLALRAGDTLRVLNSDDLTHNVRVSAPKNGLVLNRSQAKGSAPLELCFERAELGARVACDLHPWMGAVLYVLDHPFYAVSKSDGEFAIEGLPEGAYELEVVHPELARQRLSRDVRAGESTLVDVSLARQRP
jgi:plastocyanin